MGMAYSVELCCRDVVEWEGGRADVVEGGGKVLLPGSVLEELVGRPSLPYPLLFKITNPEKDLNTHVGVLEFVADPGAVVLPTWVMAQLELEPGDPVKVTLAQGLPVATFARFQPQSERFLLITDPKAVLENSLRKFACLTTGDIFHIDYNNQVYRIKVEETRPGPAVNIIECDMEVEFSAPLDYVEPLVPTAEPVAPLAMTPSSSSFVPFSGEGKRLDGKASTSKPLPPPQSFPVRVGIPDYDYVPNRIDFFRNNLNVKVQDDETGPSEE